MSSNLLQMLRQWFPPGDSAEVPHTPTDRELLAEFAKQRTQGAFNQLIHRHGSMVLGVCRRLLRQEQDVEDAFQAVFLVLARRAGDVNWQPSIGGWLHETAVRVATHARARDLKRREHETRACDMTAAFQPPPELGRGELREIFDDEIRQLPPKYQQPLVLCYLEGKSHVEAAAELGWPVGSVKGRLARAREELRLRLVRRGVTVGAAAFAMLLLADTTSSAVPYPLAAATASGAAALLAQGAGAIEPGVRELVEATLKREQGSLGGRRWLLPAGGFAAAGLGLWFFLAWGGWRTDPGPRSDDVRPSNLPPRQVGRVPDVEDPNILFAGRWNVVSWTDSGRPRRVPAGSSAGISYDRLLIQVGKRLLEFKVRLVKGRAASAIDLSIEEAGIELTWLGVYELSEDRLTIACSKPSGLRPISVAATDPPPDLVIVLERAQAAGDRQ